MTGSYYDLKSKANLFDLQSNFSSTFEVNEVLDEIAINLTSLMLILAFFIFVLRFARETMVFLVHIIGRPEVGRYQNIHISHTSSFPAHFLLFPSLYILRKQAI